MSYQTISRFLLLTILGGMCIAFFHYLNQPKSVRVVREYYACVSSLCREFPGAGRACLLLPNDQMSKITITTNDNSKTILVSASEDRCHYGGD